MKKKDLPLNALLTLNKIDAILDKNLVQIIKDNDVVLHIKDKDLYSDFYFKIERIRLRQDGGDVCYDVSYKPHDNIRVEAKIDNGISGLSLMAKCKNWVSMLKEYMDAIPLSFCDDDILNQYFREFEHTIKNVDEDAEYAPFNIQQQFLLDVYLTKVIDYVSAQKNEKNTEEIESIIEDASKIKQDLTKLTKSQTLTRFNKLWAKARKAGMNVFKEVVINLATEIFSKMIFEGRVLG